MHSVDEELIILDKLGAISGMIRDVMIEASLSALFEKEGGKEVQERIEKQFISEFCVFRTTLNLLFIQDCTSE